MAEFFAVWKALERASCFTRVATNYLAMSKAIRKWLAQCTEKFSIIPRLANIFDSTVSRRVAVTRFVDYAPLVFQRIRAGFGIRHEDYLKSVGPEQLLGNMILGNLSSLSELSSEGKSGAFFYYTADGKYMMKTVTPKDFPLAICIHISCRGSVGFACFLATRPVQFAMLGYSSCAGTLPQRKTLVMSDQWVVCLNVACL
ncbi:unnamed protein product, partial [Prorocentrum cordatum]